MREPIERVDGRTAQLQPTCVITMLELRHAWWAPLLRLHFGASKRRILSNKEASQRLLLLSLLKKSRRSFVIISCWSEPAAIMHSAVGEHVGAVRFAYARCSAVWSTQWHLTRVSPGCRQWPGWPTDWDELARAANANGDAAAAMTACNGTPYDMTLERYGKTQGREVR